MATVAATSRIGNPSLASASFECLAAACAVLAGALTFVYSIAFVILVSDPLASACLLANGLLAIALWGQILSQSGAIG